MAHTDSSVQKKRKKVGLVLSGGGAKGAAQIGALKVIDSLGIPIDYVVGTSVGSIIGGLYAIGYTPEQIDSMMRRQDWSALLSDKKRRNLMSMSEREVSEKYVLSLPLKKRTVKNLTGGLVKGQNILNLLSELTIGYHDSIDFNILPIPFACVAQDVVTGEEVDFHSGVLATAMRASMAVPGMLTPVRMDSLVLVDGGMVNNYPVNLVRKMGADIVIGIDVQNELKTFDKLDGTADIIHQIIGLMGQELYEKNVKNTDAYIKINVEGYSMTSFNREAIDTLMQRGENTALGRVEDLMALKRAIGLPDDYVPTRPARYPSAQDRKMLVREVRFDGINEEDKKWLLKRCELEENTLVSISDIEKAIHTLCSNLEYSNASYTLPWHPDGGYVLHFALTKKYEQRLNVGLRFDTEETASVIANWRHSFRSRMPMTLSLTARLGKRYAGRVDFTIEPLPLRRIGLSYLVEYNDVDFTDYSEYTHNTQFWYNRAEFSFADVWHRNVRYSFGLRYESYNYKRVLFQDGSNHPYDFGNEHFIGYFAQLHYDSYNHAYFPTKGLSMQASYVLYTDNFAEYKGHSPFSAIRGHIGVVIPLTKRFVILPDVYGRALIGRGIPYAKFNFLGGDVPSRYINQQLPFLGINGAAVMDKVLFLGALKLRQHLGKIHYVSLAANYALSSGHIKDIFHEKALFGCGIGYGINSMLGPLEASFNYTNHGNEVSFYLNLGYKF